MVPPTSSAYPIGGPSPGRTDSTVASASVRYPWKARGGEVLGDEGVDHRGIELGRAGQGKGAGGEVGELVDLAGAGGADDEGHPANGSSSEPAHEEWSEAKR